MANSLVKTKKKFSVAIQEDKYKALINNTLGNPKKAERFIAAISSAVAINPALQECDDNSIITAALLGETLNLSPSPQLGQYYLVPYDTKNGKIAQFQLGYKGYIQLAIRSGYYERLNVVEIKEGELMSYNPLDEEIKVSLITDEEERENTPTIGYYAMFRYHNGFIKSMYWSRNKMEAFALKYSKGYRKKSGYTFWEKDFDAMARKTMLRQLISKWGIMSIEMQKALDSDMAVVNEDGTVDYIDSDYEEDNSSPSNVETPSENDTTVVESNADIENDPLA